MLLLPYRAKNPPEHFPYITIALIVINTLVFLLTSDNFVVVREEIVENYALSHETLSLLRLITSMFLHGSLFHLAGNMLALWLFGASLEGRLRPAKYLLLYLLSGIAGSLAHDLMFGIAQPDRFSLGASGAIMGLSGAYLYVFPYSTICIFWLFYFRGGVMEWQARWIVLWYIGFDLLNALLFKAGDGVAHFAHLGGFGMGLLCMFLMRVRRDSEELSAVQATRAETKDFSLLSYNELETLMQHPTEDVNLIMAYLEKGIQYYGGGKHPQCLQALYQHSRLLMERADPQRLAYILIYIPVAAGGMPPVFYLRLASRLESLSSNDLASQLYRRVYDLAPNAPDTEAALFRLGQLMERAFQNRQHAYAVYMEQLRLFPHGELSLHARRSLQQMQG